MISKFKFLCLWIKIIFIIIANNSLNENNNEVFRSPASDIEIPKLRKRNQKEDDLNGSVLDPLAMTKENMSTSNRRPTGN